MLTHKAVKAIGRFKSSICRNCVFHGFCYRTI